MSSAWERRIVFSRSRERRSSVCEGRLGSNAGEVIGESSVVMVKRPSKGRSGRGCATVAEICVCTLKGVRMWSLGLFGGCARKREN